MLIEAGIPIEQVMNGTIKPTGTNPGEKPGFERKNNRNPLRLYHDLHKITDSQLRAGTRLKNNYDRTLLQGSPTYDGVPRQPGYRGLAESKLIALEIHRRAIESIPGVRVQKLVFDVCCRELYFKDITSAITKTGGMQKLRKALDCLANHYEKYS